MDSFEFAKAFDFVWSKVQGINRRIDDEKPWVLAKQGETKKLEKCMNEMINELIVVSKMLSPFIPDTAKKIEEIFDGEIVPPKVPLFPKN